MLQVPVVAPGGGRPTLRCALARRERQILALVAEGRPTKEIAYVLGIGVNTVSSRLAKLSSRLGLNRIQLAIWVISYPEVLAGAAVENLHPPGCGCNRAWCVLQATRLNS